MDKRALTLIDLERMALAAEAYRSAIGDIAAETGFLFSAHVWPDPKADARTSIADTGSRIGGDAAEQLADLGGAVTAPYGTISVTLGSVAAAAYQSDGGADRLAARAVQS